MSKQTLQAFLFEQLSSSMKDAKAATISKELAESLSEWARIELKSEINPDSSLSSPGNYIRWPNYSERDQCCLDGIFSSDDLFAIAIYMKANAS